MKSSSRFLILLLGLTLALAACSAVEAWRATRSHRVTAERALRDYATVAAWEFLSAIDEELQRRAGAALGAGRRESRRPRPTTRSPPPPRSRRPRIRCCRALHDGLRPLRLRARPPERRARDRRAPRPRPRSAPGWATRRGRRAGASRRCHGATGRLLWGPGAGPVAVFAVKTRPLQRLRGARGAARRLRRGDLPRRVRAAVRRRRRRGTRCSPPRWPAACPTPGWWACEVIDPEGQTLFHSGPPATTGAYAGDPASNPGSILVRASLPPDVAGQLVVARPGARLPLLLGLLALTAGLTAVAARQLRREQELVRLRNDFTSSVSHELRTPLTQILLFAETLELGRAAGEDDAAAGARDHRAGGAPAGSPGGERAAPLARRAAAGARAARADRPRAAAPRDRGALRAAGRLGGGAAPHRAGRDAGRDGGLGGAAPDRDQPARQRGQVRRRRARSRSAPALRRGPGAHRGRGRGRRAYRPATGAGSGSRSCASGPRSEVPGSGIGLAVVRELVARARRRVPGGGRWRRRLAVRRRAAGRERVAAGSEVASRAAPWRRHGPRS